jgi:hypothetical protein
MVMTMIDQRLLETYFEVNQISSSSDFIPPEELESEPEFMYSFILPLGPVSGSDIEWICQRKKCTRCQKMLELETFPYVYSNAQYCSQGESHAFLKR